MRISASFDISEKTKPLLTLCFQGFIRFDIESGDPYGAFVEPFLRRLDIIK